MNSRETRREFKELRSACRSCKACSLKKHRTRVVFGRGDLDAKLMFIGEGPGRDEDRSGRPFVGKAGRLLTDMIEAMNLERDDVYITNVVKCRPAIKKGGDLRNRPPEDDEVDKCFDRFLAREIQLVRPEVIVTLGRVSTCSVLNRRISITKVRGVWYDTEGIEVMPTFHPAFLLREPAQKKLVWKDLQKVMKRLGIK